MKILAFGATYSEDSINKKLAAYTALQFGFKQTEVLDLNEYPLPLYTVDVEKKIGLPQEAKDFVEKIEEADVLVISISEHNGTYTTAFKNLFDWASRVKLEMFEDKKILLLSTAPGLRGGISGLEAAKSRFPIHGTEIIGAFSLPEFYKNFSEKEGILDKELKQKFQEVLYFVKQSLGLPKLAMETV